ncbi:GDSL Lipase/Acylhydrolase family protein [Sporothrix schenckii 1099-18]|uniref:SGNH hydrolase-type esterase domain-containing protein n=2 Tax=Sporothrix schenckii TaxID=29908 RepID=U7Q8M3_SPOS1|nr:GDSL Lipase/Acylhydrolase family protein [Sporothrix schenckii 1099-18]ERT03380.1 hypothetical protein HMPREF1624_01694 [Sporothrix schenckii ATCC 58251]KJR84176.1 GDSL Lipase/Acylhydrolase family protein [Sporothrix schenckii 1099-18]
MATLYPQVVLFGDSIVRGAADTRDGFSLQSALQTHCIRRFDVVNRGLGGYNSSQALRVLPSIFQQTSPSTPDLSYLVVLLGANDAALPRDVDNQHVPLEQYKANLRRIVTHPNIQAHAPKIILVTPPPLNGFHLGQLERQNTPGAATSRQARITAQYTEAARGVANDVPGVELVDLSAALMQRAIEKTPGWDASAGVLLGDEQDSKSQEGYLRELLTDGLHLTGGSYRIFWELLRPHIDLPPNALDTSEGFVLPDWKVAPWMEEDIC